MDEKPAAPRVWKQHRLDADGWAEEGRWVSVSSSWVKGIRYDRINKRLFVEYKSGVVCLYNGIASVTAKNMFNAGSMGKFVHKNLYHRPYQLLVTPRQRSRRKRR